MTPNMHLEEMLDSFIFIVKGSRVIDRTADIDWGKAYWLPEKQIARVIFSVTDLQRYFAHRRAHSTWDPTPSSNCWLMHRERLTAQTLSAAMRFADMVAKGKIAARLDCKVACKDRAPLAEPPEWVTKHASPIERWTAPVEHLICEAREH